MNIKPKVAFFFMDPIYYNSLFVLRSTKPKTYGTTRWVTLCVTYLHSGRHSEVMMTPEDFLRSITPGMQQPEHLGLDQGSNSKIEN